MNARIDWHISKRAQIRTPYGIIFADLNGLKQCNDNGGHDAGDKLLQNAAKILKKHFDEYEIYRSGGDEFVVIAQDCDKEKFQREVEELRSETGFNSEVSLSIGTDWSEEGDDLRKCMHIADEAMYADKKEFYRQHPEKARK
jgi:diguanylate cyclase (GGDEF)-like protein